MRAIAGPRHEHGALLVVALDVDNADVLMMAPAQADVIIILPTAVPASL